MAKIKVKIIMVTVFVISMACFLYAWNQTDRSYRGTPPYFQKNGISFSLEGPKSSFECEYLEVKEVQYTHVRYKGFYTLVKTQKGIFIFPREEIIESGNWIYKASGSFDGFVRYEFLVGPLKACPEKEDLMPPGPKKSTPYIVAGLSATMCVVGAWFLIKFYQEM